MKRAERTSRKQLAYEVLRDRILTLELEPNSPIFEDDIATQLGISRTPVREALAALERENLVRIVRGKGAFVSPVSINRIMEIYHVREVLEGLAARLSVGKLSYAELNELKDVFEGCMQGRITDVDVVTGTADKLHELIVAASGNEHLQHLLKSMSDEVRRLRFVTINRANRIQDSAAEHLQIIEVILKGAPDLAESTMREHIRKVRLALEAVLTQKVMVQS